MLAIKPEALHSGPQGFFWLFGGGSMPNERRGDVAIVYVRGALDHHADSWGENYESIASRVRDAMSGDDAKAAHKRAQQRHEWENGHKAGYLPMPDAEPSKPRYVLLEIDSPGGVVSGLNETVAKLQALSKEYGVPIVTYCNEMAASAAFALACSGSRIYCPPSAIVGSIGVISTMASQSEADKRAGVDYRLITSGARKADGHPHQPISGAAEKAEKARVMELADAFWTMAAKARGVEAKALEKLQAGIFLGADAKRHGLVDDVRSLDDVIEALNKPAPAKSTGSQTIPLDSQRLNKSRSDTLSSGTHRPERSMNLSVLIAKTEAKLAAETEPRKIAALVASLDAYKKAEKDCDDEEDDDEDEEKKAAAALAAKEEGERKEKEKKARKEKKAEDDGDEAKAALALLEQTTGLTGAAALGKAAAVFARMEQAISTTAELQKSARSAETADLLKRGAKYIQPNILGTLAKQGLEALRACVTEAEKGAPMVMTEEGALLVPNAVKPNTKEALSKDVQMMIDSAVAVFPVSLGAEKKAAFEADLVRRHLEDQAKALNGAGSRY
jgi:ClpP class serine protease